MLMSGSGESVGRRNDVVARSAVVYEEEQSPTVRSPLLNGAVDDWSTEPASHDWDGRELDGGSQNLTAIAGLLAVAGAGFFATRAVGTLFNHRSDLARIVPHPVSFSVSSSTADPSSPRNSLEADDRLKSRPLSPRSVAFLSTQDRGTSPFPDETGMDRSTSMGSLAQASSIRELELNDDAVSATSAADGIDAASTVSSLESSDLGSLDMREATVENRELPQFRSMSPELVKALPHELTLGTLRERAQIAMRAAHAATEAAQRASAFSAAASTASATASQASSQAMAAAALAHIALESGNVEQMTTAQAEAWKAIQTAAKAESRAAEAAALATAYEDLSQQQARVARELSQPPPRSFLKVISQRISDFFYPITATVVGIASAVVQWFAGIWTYFSSGTCWRQICSLIRRPFVFVSHVFLSFCSNVKETAFYIFSSITGLCTYVGKSIHHGVDSCVRFLKVLYTRIFHPKGSIGGEATA